MGLTVRTFGAVGLLMMLPALGAAADTHRHHRGAAMFFGREPLHARIREHEGFLPPEVVRCANCHGDGASPPTPSTGGVATLMAALKDVRSRRGGPPSTYDRASFCRLLRTGVDPAHVVVAREMPVYEIDDGRCHDLWRYLTEEGAGPDVERK